MPGLGLSLRHSLGLSLRCEQRLELRAPSPEGALTGLDGIRAADRILKGYNVVGMLVGGLAKELWHGTIDADTLASHKDVDVLILSYDCEQHPQQWEEGIDWWIGHTSQERPTNGTSVGLTWMVSLEPHAVGIPRGLYLCPIELLLSSVVAERKFFREHRPTIVRLTKKSPSNLLPQLDQLQLRWDWGTNNAPVAEHCKPR